MATPETCAERLRERIDALPAVALVREAAAGAGPHLVGGAVRDLMLGAGRVDVDVVIAGDALAVARALDPDAVLHQRFGTATARVDGVAVDLAGARSEAYAAPGALPEVRPGTLAEDLARRDFTVNAMAAPLSGPARLIDPHRGAEDLERRVLRVLHPASFTDDPTRALRAARYAARLGLEVEAETLELLADARLETVSAQRVEAELRRIAAEADPAACLALLGAWGVLGLDAERLALAGKAMELAGPERAARGDAVVALSLGDLAPARALAALAPESPSAAVGAAHGHDATTLLLARGLGGEWIGDYLRRWRQVRLEITGTELLEAGVAEGPAVGRGLAAALRAKLDGEAPNRDQELRVALAAAEGV